MKYILDYEEMRIEANNKERNDEISRNKQQIIENLTRKAANKIKSWRYRVWQK